MYQITDRHGTNLIVGSTCSWYSWRYKSNIVGTINSLIVRPDQSVWAKVVANREYLLQVPALKHYPQHIIHIKP